MNVKHMMNIHRTIYCIASWCISNTTPTIRNKNIISLYSRRIIFTYLTTIVVGRHGNITMILISSFLFDGHDTETSRQNLSDSVIIGFPPSKTICFEKMREIFFLSNKLSVKEEKKFIYILTLEKKGII